MLRRALKFQPRNGLNGVLTYTLRVHPHCTFARAPFFIFFQLGWGFVGSGMLDGDGWLRLWCFGYGILGVGITESEGFSRKLGSWEFR